jgi:hypothetical protein
MKKFDKPIRRLAPTVEEWPTQTDTDTFSFVFSNENVGRDGFIVRNSAINHKNFDRNPVVLFAHDDTQPPIGRGTNIVTNRPNCTIDITFVPREVLPFAGTIRDLVAGKWLRAVSLSWQPIEYKRSTDPDIAAIFTEVDMLECSIVPLPALPDALLDARSHGVDTAPLYQWAERLLDKGGMLMVPRDELEQLRRAAKMPAKKRAEAAAEWKVGASKDLPIEDSDSWDGAAAEASIFEHAGGDDFDSTVARKGFLAYNAAEPDKRGSYKLPIAHVVDGEMKVPKGAIRAAASRLSQTDIPDDVKKSAGAVLDHYKEKAGIGDDDKERAVKPKRAFLRSSADPLFKRGLYDVGRLCFLLEELGYAHFSAACEAEMEGDGSKVPAMLFEVLEAAAEACKEMADEEIGELLAVHGPGDDSDDDDEEMRALKPSARAFIAAGKTPRSRALRRGIAIARAGKELSVANKDQLEAAQAHHERALKHHSEMHERTEAGAEHLATAQERSRAASQTLAEFGEHVRAAQDDPAKAKDHMEAADKAKGETEKHLAAADEAHDDAKDAHEDADDSHRAVGRRIRAAKRCVRTVLSGAVTSEADDTDADSQEKKQAADEEKARAARAARAKELARKEPITLTLD